MVKSISEVLDILDEGSLKSEFLEFENTLNSTLKPLVDKLGQSVFSSDVVSLQQHMSYVESWRERVVRYQSLAAAFVEHSKSSFPYPGGEKTNADTRDAYRRKMATPFIGLQKYIDGLVDCIDSRVNLCKKAYDGQDSPGGIRSNTSIR